MLKETPLPDTGLSAVEAVAPPPRDRLPRILCAAMALQFAAGGAVIPFITLLLRDRGLDFAHVSQIFLASSASLLVFPFLWGMLADRWVPHATADDYDEALRLCSEEAARLLVDEWEFTLEDAFIFLSVACDAGVAQACKPAPGFGTIARFAIPKLEATPRPFRGSLQSG